MRDFRDCEAKLMAARSELGKARGERDEFGAILAAIRVALGCEPGGEVEAVQAAVNGCDEWERLNNQLSRELAAERRRLGVVAPRPGDVLDPADFGKGEAGVLRLAALLSEAPDGAAVSYMPEWGNSPVVLRKDGGCWDDSEGRLIFMWIARRAPLTVVAWPS